MIANHTLSQVLKYHNQTVLDRYTKDYASNEMPAEEAFSELVKYMWLCQQHKIDQLRCNDTALAFTCVMHPEMREIDHMWHTFLLFTKDYQDFCMGYFGDFFHHQPLSDEEKNMPAEQYTIELQRYLTYIYDKLGEQTLSIWFGECLLD